MKKFNVNYLWYVAALIFYISTILSFFRGGDFDTMSFCLGSAMLCIGCSVNAAEKNKEKNKEGE